LKKIEEKVNKTKNNNSNEQEKAITHHHSYRRNIDSNGVNNSI
jgi:hypothetical protein